MPKRKRQQHAPQAHKAYKQRLVLLYLVIALCFSLLAGGLAYRQLLQTESYLAAEERQNYRRILKPGPRGNIYDRNGELLVGNRPYFSATVYLNELRPEFRREFIRVLNRRREQGLTPDRFALAIEARRNVVQRYQNQINRILDRNDVVEPRRIERHFSQNLLLPYPLLLDISAEDYARLIEQLPIDSPVQVTADTARYYPHGSAAAHALGYVSDSQELPVGDLPGEGLLTFRFDGKVGRTGLEARFNEHLQGVTGGEIWSVDPGGFQHERIVFEQPKRGQDLVTTLDIRLQRAAEQAFGDYLGAAVAIEISSGEVLAMVSKPDYDLNDLTPFIPHTVDARIREEGGWLNRAIQGLYPPGSTFKLITTSAGLRRGLIEQSTEIYCPGYFRVGRRTFRCHNRSGHGHENLIEAIRDSCNVFYYDRGLAMGVQAIADEARRFGLHEPTGIELPNETRRMIVPDPAWKANRFYGESWFDGDTANLSIGQGFLLITPLQMAVMTASYARGVTGITPTVVRDQAGNPGSRRNQRAIEAIGITDEQLAWIHTGMIEAGRTGTARRASSPNFIAAGKTGTAQIRRDGRPATLAWYVGFAPADDPQIAVAILIEGVIGDGAIGGGGATAAPIARTIFEQWIGNSDIELSQR
ncbi:MAG: penicillin-binding protein 2 [Opitutales bacterium]|nr:penicillin-binding protein 2 [Opitutales bacterium]